MTRPAVSYSRRRQRNRPAEDVVAYRTQDRRAPAASGSRAADPPRPAAAWRWRTDCPPESAAAASRRHCRSTIAPSTAATRRPGRRCRTSPAPRRTGPRSPRCRPISSQKTGPSGAISCVRGKVGAAKVAAADDARPRQRRSRATRSADREHRAFRHQISHDASARRAQRRTDRELAPPARHPRDQQVRRVRAGDQPAPGPRRRAPDPPISSTSPVTMPLQSR